MVRTEYTYCTIPWSTTTVITSIPHFTHLTCRSLHLISSLLNLSSSASPSCHHRRWQHDMYLFSTGTRPKGTCMHDERMQKGPWPSFFDYRVIVSARRRILPFWRGLGGAAVMGGRQAGKLRKVLSGTHSCSLHMIDRRTKTCLSAGEASWWERCGMGRGLVLPTRTEIEVLSILICCRS